MNPAAASLLALAVAVAAGASQRVNAGVVALALAWLVGRAAGLDAAAVAAGFPLRLFFILFGMTFFFAGASANGTLDAVAQRCLRLSKGRKALLPPLFFLLGASFSAAGPGNIAACALMSPLVMSLAGRSGISAFLATVMLVNGANAGAFSPLAPTGIIANGLVAAQGLVMSPWRQVFLPSFLAQTFIACAAFLLLGGLKLRGESSAGAAPVAPWTTPQLATLAAIAALIAGVSFFRADPGLLALTLAAILAAAGLADHEKSFAETPWSAILMVCGVSTLVAVLEKSGGMGLFTDLLARFSTPRTAPGLLALAAGTLSSYSSSSGVVMPAMIPLVPALIAKLGGGDPVALVSSINVGSHAVDVSPLSTLGAMCIAHAAAHEDKRRLFRRLLVNGLAMAVFAAIVCQLIFGLTTPG